MAHLPPSSYPAALTDLLTRHGCDLVDTPLLQPADLFLDLSGEDIRRRLFLTQDSDGREWCLRPEYTIPVCRTHLERHAGTVRDYCYLGSVFRQRPNQSGEFQQAGLELIGRDDIAATDADVIGLALDGLDVFRVPDQTIRLGDMGLLDSVLRAIEAPDALRRRLLRDIAAGRAPGTMGTDRPASATGHSGLLAAIDGQDPKAARRFVEDVLAIAGIAQVGGRSAGEIAERFLSRAGNRGGGLPAERGEVLARYLAIGGDPDAALIAVRNLARDAGLDIEPALDLFEQRTGFMAARGLPIERFAFAANFARTLDYYSGFIFEIASGGEVLAAGGRYDRLLRQLGASSDIPAAGCSFWLDRIVTGSERGDER